MLIGPGTKLGRFEIRAKIVKILPVEVASHRDRMGRFIREAKSAAALNHPNIATIHEIGEQDGAHFIAWSSSTA